MTEETDGHVEAGEGESHEVESNSEATTEQDTGTDDAGQADDSGDEAEEQPKRVPWFQKRIDEVTAKKYEAEREAAYWRGIAEGRIQPEQQQQAPEGPPDRWEDPEGYDQWLIDQAVSKFQQNQQRQTVVQSYEQRAAEFRQSKPDFDAVVHDPSLRISPTMAEVIRVSEAGPQVAYHLGTNPSEAARIAALPDTLQAAELGRIEARLTYEAPKAQPQKAAPPPPPKTVAGLSAGINKDPADMSMAEYVKWMANRG